MRERGEGGGGRGAVTYNAGLSRGVCNCIHCYRGGLGNV